jgi:hypothetical protein
MRSIDTNSMGEGLLFVVIVVIVVGLSGCNCYLKFVVWIL